MTLYVVIWRPYDATDFFLTDVYLPDDLDPDSMTDDNWVNRACEIEEDDLEENEKSQPPSIMGCDFVAVLRGPVTLIR